ANAGQADGELLFLGVENELLFFNLSRGRDHVGSASDGSGLTRDAAIGFALTVFSDGDAPNPVRFPRNTRDLQSCAVEVDLPSVEIDHNRGQIYLNSAAFKIAGDRKSTRLNSSHVETS